MRTAATALLRHLSAMDILTLDLPGVLRVLAEDAVAGLRQALSGQFVSDAELDEALGVAPVR